MSWLVDPESREPLGPVNQREWDRLERIAGRSPLRRFTLVQVVRDRKGQPKRITVKPIAKNDFERPSMGNALSALELKRRRESVR